MGCLVCIQKFHTANQVTIDKSGPALGIPNSGMKSLSQVQGILQFAPEIAKKGTFLNKYESNRD